MVQRRTFLLPNALSGGLPGHGDARVASLHVGRPRWPFGARAIGRVITLAGALTFVAALAPSTGCSGAEAKSDELAGVPEPDRTAVRVARSEQLQVGFRLDALVARDDVGEVCHEICAETQRSCALGEEICSFGTKYPNAIGLHAKCRAARDLCRTHGTQIPRHCVCDR